MHPLVVSPFNTVIYLRLLAACMLLASMLMPQGAAALALYHVYQCQEDSDGDRVGAGTLLDCYTIGAPKPTCPPGYVVASGLSLLYAGCKNISPSVLDKFPYDPGEWLDSDNDGIGDNADPDDDNDSVLDATDNCPLNANVDQLDTDGDGTGNVCDTDDDNDGTSDTSDKFPLNPAASSDSDNDGFPGSWRGACDATCQINSGLTLDNCPTTANADQLDSDGDGQGDVCDKFPLNPAAASDSDNDGFPNNWNATCDATCQTNAGLTLDNCPTTANADQLDSDGDGQGDVCDKFPLNAAAASDSDNDGFPDSWNATCDATCQTNAGLILDNCPTTANADQLDTEGDGQGNACDSDDDNDGVNDGSDAFPLDPTDWLDTDNDSLGNNADLDDDNDGMLDNADNCPLDHNPLQTNDDGDTSGNACDDDGPGRLDVNFNPGTGANNSIAAISLQPDGKLLIGGVFTSYNGIARNRMARVNTDGSLDTSFNPGTGADNSVTAMALQPDGKLLIHGTFASYNGTARNRMARVNTDGSLDTSFNPGNGPNGSITAIAFQPDGKLLIGGYFTSYNGIARNRMARVHADGSLDTSFNPGTGANNSVTAIALQPNGKLLIGGNFTSYNGIAINRIARLDADGAMDTSFNPGTGANNSIAAITLQPDSKLLIGGNFTSYNGIAINRIARLDADGAMDTSFNPGTGANNSIAAITLQPDSKLLIGGDFTSYNGIVRKDITRINADGSLDWDFNPGSDTNGNVLEIIIQPQGRAVLGGNFTTYNGTSLNRIAFIHTGDKDQDGIEDAADHFPDNAAAAEDTDKDGKPDVWLQPNAYACAANATTCNGLTLDLDDDNDGVPDYIDAEPLNPANSNERALTLDGTYKGSAVQEAITP